jgi:hypothetical protein
MSGVLGSTTEPSGRDDPALQAEARQLFEEKLRAMVELGGADLLVADSPALAGLGVEVDGAAYSLDVLRFYEGLLALRRGAILSELQDLAERRVVWEIGAGWGGFAYRLKSLCPNLTYVISDAPAALQPAAAYLAASFPEARCVFAGDGSSDDPWRGWSEADFVFVPDTRVEAIRPGRLDLTISMLSFQELPTEQVRGYVRHAYRQHCRYLYSLHGDCSASVAQSSDVRAVIAEYYWPHPIAILPVLSHAKVLDEPPSPGREYQHLVGWRRLVV